MEMDRSSISFPASSYESSNMFLIGVQLIKEKSRTTSTDKVCTSAVCVFIHYSTPFHTSTQVFSEERNLKIAEINNYVVGRSESLQRVLLFFEK